MEKIFKNFTEVNFIHFLFEHDDGELLKPVSMTCCNLTRNGLAIYSREQLNIHTKPPFATNQSSLVIASNGSNDIGCFLSLNWNIPCNIIDAYAEWRTLTNSVFTNSEDVNYRNDTLSYRLGQFFKSKSIKELYGKTYRDMDCLDNLEASQNSITCIRKIISLFQFYKNEIDLRYALIRGAYTAELCKVEKYGIPIDVEKLRLLLSAWGAVKSELISAVDKDYCVFKDDKFNIKKFRYYIENKQIDWKKSSSGKYLTDADTFKEMSEIYPEVKPLRDLKRTLSTMSNLSLSVGKDGRNRTPLNPYKSKTGRNQPSSSRSIFGLPCWLR